MIHVERLWPLVIPVIALAILWWRRRREHAITRRTVYLELWEKAAEGTRIWERWRWTPTEWSSLFLCLASFAGALAAMQPSWMGPGGGHYRVILDRSASMAAKASDGRSRWDEGLRWVRGFLRSRSPGDEISLWTLGETLDPIVAQTDDLTSVEESLAQLAPNAASADPHLLTKTFVASEAETTLFVSDLPSEGNWNLVGVGEPVNNAGILSFRVEGAWPKKSLHLRGEILNGSSSPQSRTLRLFAGSNEKRQEISLQPAQRMAFDLEWERGGAEQIHLRLEPEDAFAGDDEALVDLVARAQAPLVLLGAPESDEISPLAAAAGALSEENEIPLRKGTESVAPPPGSIFLADGGRFESLPSGAGGAILFGSQIPGILGEPALQRPKVLDWKREHPILRGLVFDYLACKQAWSVVGEANPLIRSAEGPLLIAGERDGARFVITSFRLADSNLPVQAHFPVLLRRAYAWILGNPVDGTPALLGASPRAPFLDPTESALENSPPRGPSKPIPDGPGRSRGIAGECIFAALAFLLLGLFLGRGFR